jgi:hypothetical protein
MVNMKKSLFIMFIFILTFAVGSSVYKISNSNPASTTIQPEEKERDKEKESEDATEENASDQEELYEEPKINDPSQEDSSPQNPPVELTSYNGPIEHIFFHPLVIYPSLAFDGDAMSKGYNEYFVTVKEFNDIIQSLYEKKYILIKMSDLFEVKKIEGKRTLVKKELKLPKNKIPLILSVDDINYYQYMIKNGNAHQLVIDPSGDLAAYSKDLSGKDVTSKENEIVPLLNQFVQDHPDFSFNGAKGILAFTGYEGILGYRTNTINSPNYQHEKDEAMKIIQKLKEAGWEFASHGYGHLPTNDISLQNLKNDTKQWMEEVSPLIGGTNIYIYPFGNSILPGDEKFQYLKSAGFDIFCSVGPNPYLNYTEEYAMMDRVHIDGISLETQQHILNRFFESEQILDEERYRYK